MSGHRVSPPLVADSVGFRPLLGGLLHPVGVGGCVVVWFGCCCGGWFLLVVWWLLCGGCLWCLWLGRGVVVCRDCLRVSALQGGGHLLEGVMVCCDLVLWSREGCGELSEELK